MGNDKVRPHGGEESYRLLEVFHPLREGIVRDAAAALRLAAGSRGLDAGCGVGLAAFTLAEAVGPQGRVVGLDLSAHCALGPYWGAKLGCEEMVAFQASARGGVVRVTLAGDRVKLAGKAVTVLRGKLAA